VSTTKKLSHFFLAIDSFFYFQAALVLSKISPEIVGEPVEVNRLYDAVNCLMSYMVNISNFLVVVIILSFYLHKRGHLNISFM
jgi:hypothetical protein